MPKATKAKESAQVRRLREALAREKDKSAALARERTEAREQQAAAAEILKVLSRSPGDAQPVFEAIVKHAMRLLGGHSALMTRVVDGVLDIAALTSTSRKGDAAVRSGYPRLVSKATAHGQALFAKAPVITRDTEKVANTRARAREVGRARGYRSLVVVPLLLEGSAVGTIAVTRKEPGGFSKRQVDLLQTFAEQAVIATENVRRFNETKQALERQTATADILKVISRSPTDTQPVFDTIAQSAARLCEAKFSYVFRFDGQLIHLVAHVGPPQSLEAVRQAWPRAPGTGTAAGRAVLQCSIVHVPDVQADPDYVLGTVAAAASYRSTVAVPMLRNGVPIGSINVSRSQPGPFSDRQIALLRTFADQAVIAIENVRLFNETKEALERQVATADILKVIGSSPTDTQPVFDAIVQGGLKLFPEATIGVTRPNGSMLEMAAIGHRDPRIAEATRTRFPIPLTPDYLNSRAILDARVIDVLDAELEKDGPFAPGIRNFLKTGNRAMTVMPMLRGAEAIGTIGVTRAKPGPLTDKQLSLLRIFADQAVIAIENVRLFNETKEALERQTATGEVLRAISTSPTDTRPVFEAILERAAKLCGAETGILFRYADGAFHALATRIPNPEFARLFREPRRPAAGSKNGLARLMSLKRVVHIPDMLADTATLENDPLRAETVKGGMRSWLGAPLLKEGELTGAIVVYRSEPLPFSTAQIALLETFADQAVIAIENVRLFNETREALERQTATAEILRVIASSPSDVQPVFDAIVNSVSRLFGRKAALRTVESEGLRRRARSYEPTPGEFHGAEVVPLDQKSVVGQAILGGRALQWADTLVDGAAIHGMEKAKALAYRSIASAPLIRDGKAIGVISVSSPEPGTLSEKQMELLSTFADQAVIAIENVRLFNETREALERQTATAEILRVIASSPSDVQPVFDAIAASARRLLDGGAALVVRRAGDMLDLVAHTSTGEAGDAALKKLFPVKLTGSGHMGKAILTAAPVLISDIETEADYSEAFKADARTRNFRSIVTVPMLKDGVPIGGISVNRPVAGHFTEHQTNLLRTFADQAVIAIENVRLFNETKEALDRQTATAEVLKVISGSLTDTQPVFDIIAERAARLTGATFGWVFRYDGQLIHAASSFGLNPQAVQLALQKFPMPPSGGSYTARAIRDGQIMNVADALAETDPEYLTKPIAAAAGYRSVLAVPMVRDEQVIGAIVVNRSEPGRFADKEVDLLKTFADQAVIAIENVRLFDETKEALERQTATAEILQVIGSSPTEVQPVFDAIAQSAAELFGGRSAIFVREGDMVDLKAIGATDVAPEEMAARRAEMKQVYPMPVASAGSITWQAIATCKAVEIQDTEAPDAPATARETARRGGVRSLTIVPLVREGAGVGAISIAFARPGVRLNDKQLALLRTFADQAVIAIENVRLFKELEARTSALGKSVEKLTALGEVGRAISSSLELETVLKTIASHAVQLTGLDGASIYEYDEASEQFRLQAAHNFDPDFLMAIRNAPIRKGDGTVGSVAITLEPAQVTDILADGYHSSRKEHLTRAGYRAVLTVPLLSEERIIGALSVTRKAPGPFAEEIVELMKTFATQSAMAIQNARLFREIEEKGKQLEEASKHKSQFLASMSHELRTPLNAILGFNEMILGDVYGEVPADMKEPLTDIQTSGKHLLRLINNVLDLAKIEAGRMELALDDYSVHDTVESVRSTLRPLAEAKGLELAVDVPNDIPLARGDGGRITQCLMNLAGNSLKFTKQGGVGISVALTNGTLTYRVKDTGIGIPADKIDSLFTEFKQTDATIASEYGGTGLGLSITKKFIEMHGGRIWAESEPGSGSTFTFEVPLRTEEAKEA